MHEVEQATWKILSHYITHVDPQRQGICIDAGVGNQDYYFEWFANYGYKTIAIEPAPSERVRELCKARGVELVEAALCDHNGTVTLREKGDLRSANGLAFEFDTQHDYPAMTLAILIDRLNLGECEHAFTCLKLDIEGAEWSALQRIGRCFPWVVSFEFGGLFPRHTHQGGWTKAAQGNTYKCINLLRRYYANLYKIVENEKRGVTVTEIPETQRGVFDPFDIWGNIIAMMVPPPEHELEKWLLSEVRFHL